MRYEAINETLATDTWTPINLGSGQTCDSYAAQVRDGTGCRIKKTSASTAVWTIAGREKLVMNEARGVPGDTLFYAQALEGTPVLEVIITRG
jgi:hypothetical protein